MGMFDTLRVKVAGQEREVKVKDFACLLESYRIGDRVHYGEARPITWQEGPYVVIDEADSAEDDIKPMWVALLICEDTFCDYAEASGEQEAIVAGNELLELWRKPESRIRRMMLRQQQMAAERESLYSRLQRISTLLSDYYHWAYLQEFPRQKSKESRLMQMAFGPFRDYSTQTFDRWLAEELKDQVKAQTQCGDDIDVDYYYTQLLWEREALLGGHKGSDED